MLLHLLPEVLEAGDQAVVQRLQLLRRFLPVDPNPVGQERDLEEETRALLNVSRLESVTMADWGGGVTCRAMRCFRTSMRSWSSGCSWM